MSSVPTHATSLLSRIDCILNAQQYENLIARLCTPQKATTVAFVNAHAVNILWANPQIAADFDAADVLLRDGKGMEILYQKLGMEQGLNMNGTDFLPALLARMRGLPLAVYGTSQPWLDRACEKLEAQGHTLVSRCDGFKPQADYIEESKRAKPYTILLAMGMPKQESVARALRSEFAGQPVTILCGGAIVDFLAERFPRAPLWMRNLGLEWAYRLVREPRRLFQRYIIGNAIFLRHVREIERAGGLRAVK